MAEIRIGTCSWKYDSWRGIVYPESGEYDPLHEYARHFDTVEIDQWFWSLFETEKAALPDPAVARQYAAAVPADFRFTVKAPNSITLTHHYRKDKARAAAGQPPFPVARSLRGIPGGAWSPWPARSALVMLQFEYLNRQKMASLDRVPGAPGALPGRAAARRPPGHRVPQPQLPE